MKKATSTCSVKQKSRTDSVRDICTSNWGVDWKCSTYLNYTKKAYKGIKLPEDILSKITTDKHLKGHWTVKEKSNGQEDKRKKSYSLVPFNKE